VTFSIQEVTDRGELSALEPEWGRFVADVPVAELFSTPAWVTSWLDAFWEGRPIRFLFARDDGRLVGVAPLLVDEEGTFCCRGALALPVDSVSWRGEVLHTPAAGDATLDAMLGHLAPGGGVRLNLRRLADDSTTARALRAAVQRRGLWGTWRTEDRTPIITVPGSIEEYLQSRTKHVRHELRRKQKRLLNAGPVEIRIVQQDDELHAAFEDVRAIEAKSWKGEVASSFLESPGAEKFYRTLFAKSAGVAWPRIYVMHFKGKPAAHVFGMVFRDQYYAFNSSFDAALGGFSPGAVLILRSIEDACVQKLKVFDFMGSEYRWKNEMATGFRQHLHVCIFSNPLSRCGARWVSDQQVKPFVRRRLPILPRAKNALRTWARRGRPGGRGREEA